MFYFLKEYFEPLIPWLKVLFCVECFHFTDCKNIWRRILEIFHLSPLLISFVAPDILFVETWRMEMRKIDLKVFFRCVNLYVKRILFDLKTKMDLKLRNQVPFTLSMFNFTEWKCFIWTIKLLHLTWFIGNGKHGWPFSQRYLNTAENGGQEQVAVTYVSFIPLKIISYYWILDWLKQTIFHFLYPSCIDGRRRQFEKKGYEMMTLLAFRPSSALSLGMWEHHDRITTPRRAGSMA